MQATVLRYDGLTGDGAVLLDDGVELPFRREALRGSRLRLLRPGQRVAVGVDADDARVLSLQILTLRADHGAAG